MSENTPQLGDLVWHIHHDVLLEPLTEPFETRVAYIKENKSEDEVPTRLRLMKPVRGGLPELLAVRAAWVKARAELDEAQAAWDQARASWGKACAAWGKARAELSKAQAARDQARASWYKAQPALDQARASWGKACAAWGKAYAAWGKACAQPSVLALNAQECPACPWDGKTIFPQEP